ncbi:Uncharacterized protein C05D11.1 [Geodia barretti]|nr:Uncharacterized protein C05D11.1 [Geodia barretti]
MQGRENTAEELSAFLLARHMYPGHCGYRSNTGGKMSNLRETCSNEKVRAYHSQFYRPDNLCLIVAGQVDVDQLFSALKPFEDNIVSKGPLPPHQRPWQSAIDPLTSSISEELVFPTDEEDDGMARISWRGPPARDRYMFTAVTMLLRYLSDGPVAPLQSRLVEVPEPFCSEISDSVYENYVSCIGFTFSGVPTQQLGLLESKALEVLSDLVSGQEEVDMERMTNLIKRQLLTILDHVESSPHHYFAFALIGDFLFSQSPTELSSYLDQLQFHQRLLSEPRPFWVELIRTYFISAPHICVLARPSQEKAETMAEEENERVRFQRATLGEQALAERGRQLAEAMERNEDPCPNDVISCVPIPGTENIFFHPIVSVGNHQSREELVGVRECEVFPVHSFPFFFHLNHIHSNFVELTAILNTETLDSSLHHYLPLYLDMMFESSISQNGEEVPYEVVVKELERDTVGSSASLGFRGRRFKCGHFPSAVFVTIKVEREKYAVGVKWLHDVLFGLQFSPERVAVVATKMVNDVARMKREGRIVSRTLLNHVIFSPGSTPNTSNMVTQLKFLEKQLARLKDPATASLVTSDLCRVRDTLTSPGNLRVFMATDIDKLSTPLQPWEIFMGRANSKSSSPPLPPILPPSHSLSATAAGKTLVAGVGGVESNFLIQSVPCVRSHDHPDYPAILVFIEYLTALEGPLWRQVRGQGLAYHYNISCSVSEGLLCLRLFRATQVLQAYIVARKILSDHVDGSVGLEEGQLEAAVSGVIYEEIEESKTVAAAANQALLHHLRRVSSSFSKDLLDKVSKVTIPDLQRVGKQYFSLLLEPTTTSTAICCNPSKVPEVKAGLEKIGHSVTVVEDLDSVLASN